MRIQPALLRSLTERFGLPLHLYSLEQLARNAESFLEASARLYPGTLVTFSVKANPCRGAVRAAGRLGLGADVVSEFELQAALEEGIEPESIICNGGAKSDRFLEMIVQCGARVAVDSIEELDLLEAAAGRLQRPARALVRFSGMPLWGYTADDQATAATWTKFGVSIQDAKAAFARFGRCEHVAFEGISAHVGTQICDPHGYFLLMEHMLHLARMADRMGLAVRCLDIGGGFPVQFMTGEQWRDFTSRLRNQLADVLRTEEWVTWDGLPLGYEHLQDRLPRETDAWLGKAYWTEYPAAGMLAELLSRPDHEARTLAGRLEEIGSPMLLIEPGRSMIATAGATLTRAMGVKKVMGNDVVMLDLGINNHGTNLITPDIFRVEVLPARQDDPSAGAFLAGRLCFSGDMISKAKIRLNRLPRRGEMVVIHDTGAYCADHFASNSCGFPLPAKVAFGPDGELEVWRPRQQYEDVFGPLQAELPRRTRQACRTDS